MEWIETYLGNAHGEKDGETLRRFGPTLGIPDPEKFLTTTTVQQIAEEYRVALLAVVSLGSWRVHANNYIDIDGRIGGIGEHNPAEFFRSINNARLESAGKGLQAPANTMWYAMLGGHFLEQLVDPLKEHADLFDGVKIGAFRPDDYSFLQPQQEDLWRFCEDKNWPVLIHCSAQNSQTCLEIMELAKRYPRARFCASHLGGDSEESMETLAETFINGEGLPDNFFLNTAVKDLSLVRRFLTLYPRLINRLVHGSDIPYLGDYAEIQRRTHREFGPEELDQIMANGRRFLGGKPSASVDL